MYGIWNVVWMFMNLLCFFYIGNDGIGLEGCINCDEFIWEEMVEVFFKCIVSEVYRVW